MSLNVPSIASVRIEDPRLEIGRERVYTVLKGALVNSWQQFPATNINNSSIQITCNPPSRNIAISRLVFQRVTFDITVAGTNTGAGPLLNTGFHGPRAFPLTSVTASLQVTVNNATMTQAPIQQYWPALLWYGQNDHKNRFGQYSLAPSMLDQWQDYDDGAGSVRNPLAGYGDNSYEQSRASFSGYEVLTNTATSATIRLTTTEPILISPMVFGHDSNFTSSFAGVQNMSYLATLNGDLSRVLSLVQDQGAPGVINITGVTVNLSAASLLFEYLTPDQTRPIPRDMTSSYFSLVSYPTRTSAPIAPAGLVSITMQSIQVTSIPRRIYIFARDDDSVRTAFSSDTYLSLPRAQNPLTLTWNNNQFLAASTTQDLYNIATKNNCSMSFSQFSQFTGSVLALDFGTDIGLMGDEAPGVLGNYQLGLTCQFQNTSSRTITPTLYVVVVYEGSFNIVDGNSSQMIGVLSRENVIDSHRSDRVSFKQSQDVWGGAFWDSVKSALSKAHGFIKKEKLISRGLAAIPSPQTQIAARVASALGYGGRSGGAARMRRGMRGGALHDEHKDRWEDERAVNYRASELVSDGEGLESDEERKEDGVRFE